MQFSSQQLRSQETGQQKMSQEVAQALQQARSAQAKWASRIRRHRLRAIGRVATEIADHHTSIVQAMANAQTTESARLASEIIPLADACHFIARHGDRVLATHTQSMLHGAWWLGRIGVRIEREPWGVVLVLAPSNYPLFLPGVQVMQAIAAGNAVLVKPAPGQAKVLEVLRQCATAAGVPHELFQILPTSIDAGQGALELGVDKVVLTGSTETALAVLRRLGSSLTAITLELGGCDAAFVLPQADISRAARSIAFALTLNGGATCMAPRRIFITQANAQPFQSMLLESLPQYPACRVPRRTAIALHRMIQQALEEGAELLTGPLRWLEDLTGSPDECIAMQPIVLHNVAPHCDIAQTDIFAPITAILMVADMVDAISADEQCPYSLGASVFGPQSHAEHWARKINAGCVTINDCVVPTADPRVAFGGRNASGWGVTRGLDGLLDMTQPKTICTRYGRWLPHLHPQRSDDREILQQLLQLMHGNSLTKRLSAVGALIKATRLRKTP